MKHPILVGLSILLCVAGLSLLAHTTLIARGVADEVRTAFYSSGQTDSVCGEVLARGGMFVTCDAYPLVEDNKTVSLRGYIAVFPSEVLAKLDRRERQNKGAIGAALLNSMKIPFSDLFRPKP